MTLIPAPAMIFPDMPRDPQFVDKNGQLTPTWDTGLSSLFDALQNNFSNQGIFFPLLSAANIALIEAAYAPYIGFSLPAGVEDISGSTVFDTDNRVSKQFVITYSAGIVVTAAWRTLQYV